MTEVRQLDVADLDHGARHRGYLVDVAAPAYLVLYLVVAFQPFELFVVPPGMVFSVVLPVLGVGVLVLTPNERLARMPISVPLIAFLAWTAMSVFWTDATSSTLFVLRAQQLPVFLVALVAGTIRPELVARTVLWSGVVLTGWSLAISFALPMSRAVAQIDGLDDQAGFRGTFGHKNFLGVFAVLALATALPLLHVRGRRVVLVLLVAAALSTRSATTAGGLFALLFVWFWMLAIERGRTRRDRRLLLFVSSSSAVLGLLMVLRLLPVLLDLYDKDLTFSGRTLIWGESLRAWGERPWLGRGLGGVWTDPPTGLTIELWRHIGFKAGHAHNGVIGLLLDVGVIGVALMAVLLFSLIRRSVRALRDPQHRVHGQWGLLVVAALLIMSLAEPLFENQYLGYLAIVWAALAAMTNARRSDGDETRARRRTSTSF
jgi:O-antigen ligase